MEWPLLESRPEMINDDPAQGSRSWGASISTERLPCDEQTLTLLGRAYDDAFGRKRIKGAEHMWVFCDVEGTVVFLTYEDAQLPNKATRDMNMLFKDFPKGIRDNLNKKHAVQYVTVLHQHRIERFKIRNEFLYQNDVVTKPKLVKENINAYHDACDLAEKMGVPLVENSESIELVPYEGTRLQHIFDAETKREVELMLACETQLAETQKCFEAAGKEQNHTQFMRYDQHMLKLQGYEQQLAEVQKGRAQLQDDLRAEASRMRERMERTDEVHSAEYAQWPLGLCGTDVRNSKLYVKMMRGEDDRKQFLYEAIRDLSHPTVNGLMKDIVNENFAIQELGLFPGIKNSHTKSDTITRILYAFERRTGSPFEDKVFVKGLVDAKCGNDEPPCAFCNKTRPLHHFHGDDRFCSETCILKYRMAPVCCKCNGSDMQGIVDNKEVAIQWAPRGYTDSIHMKNWWCRTCNCECLPRDRSFVLEIQSQRGKHAALY